MKPDTLRAQNGVDDIDRVSLANGVIGAFRLACAAINAVGSDRGGHEKTLGLVRINYLFHSGLSIIPPFLQLPESSCYLIVGRRTQVVKGAD